MRNEYEGGNLLVEILKERGVKQIFSVSGGPINSIFQAASAHDLPLYHVRHEQGAGYMADAVAKVTGVPGVAAVTLGPATSNMVTNALMAKMSGTPMLIIGGQGNTRDFDRDAEMVVDSVRIMEPVTKYAARILQTDRIPEYVDSAWRAIWAGRPGPAFLEIPMDVLSAATPQQSFKPLPHFRDAPLPTETARQITSALEVARRPLVIIGDEAYWELNHGLDPTIVRGAIERHRLLFTSLRHARGIIDERHEQYCGLGCVYANKTLRHAMSEADLILLLGHQMESDLAFGEHASNDCVIVQCYCDPAYHGRGRASDIATTASVRSVVDFLQQIDPIECDAQWVAARAADWRTERTAEVEDDSGELPLHPVVAMETVVEAAPDDTIFACGAGNVDFWVDERFQARSPGTFMKGGLGGGLGADIPYGVGAATAYPNRPVVVFIGDGGMGYHGFELDTAARYGRQVVVVVLDDQKWGCIAVPQVERYGTEYEMDLPERDWPGFARSIGGFGIRAETTAELRSAMTKAFDAGVPALVHVPVRTVLSPFMEYVGY